MDSFLKKVALDIRNRFGNDLSHVAVIFPNKRASLFINDYLVEEGGAPTWSPTYLTISELFRKLSKREVGDKIRLICELYRVYLQVTGKCAEEETLDQFYSWGEVLLADFDDVDKNLAHTEKLFQNLSELKQLESLDYLTDEQKAAIEQFFHKCNLNETELQRRFESFWNILGDLYTGLNERLKENNTLYEGALYREVIEHLNKEQLTHTHYLFVGFNVLNKVEQTLFDKLKQWDKALFYWDYDTYYLERNKEAGLFLTRNLKQFGNALPDTDFHAMEQPKEVTYLSAPTENAQVRYLTPWLEANLTQPEKETAVVLCNESLLEPVLHSLPEHIENLNITMGFPLSNTPIFSFIQVLCNLHIAGYSEEKGCYRFEEVRRVLNHPYTQRLTPKATELGNVLTSQNRFFPSPTELQIDERLTALFPSKAIGTSSLPFLDYLIQLLEQIAELKEPIKETIDSTFEQLYNEALFTAYTQLNRLRKLVEEGLLQVGVKTLVGFIYQLSAGASIPFHGEPAIGLQVMGILETRNLDFKHLILLSVNEGELPKVGSDASFIPYNLRKAFGLTLIEQKMAVYAYYFYRLLQRAEKVTLLYNNNTEGLKKGEMSRFMQQYLIEKPNNHLLRQFALKSTQSIPVKRDLQIAKSEEQMEELLKKYEQHSFLSPTALNTYIDCPLKFYFKYVARLSVEDDVTNEIDSALFGTIFHRTAERLYQPFVNREKEVCQSDIDALLDKNGWIIERTVDDVLKEELFKIGESITQADEKRKWIESSELPTLNGVQYIVRQVIIRYVKQLLHCDRALTPFKIVGLEKPIRCKFTIQYKGNNRTLTLGGDIDRLDIYTSEEGERTLRIIDYKTSSVAQTPPATLEQLFTASDRRPYHLLQTFYYAMQVNENQLNPYQLPIAPALFYIQKAAEKNYMPQVSVGTYKAKTIVSDFESQFGEAYRNLLKSCIEQLFNPSIPFTPCNSNHACEWCEYNKICRR